MRTVILYEGGPMDGQREEWEHKQRPPDRLPFRSEPTKHYGGLATAARYRVSRCSREFEAIETETLVYRLEEIGIEVECAGGDG